jgi:CRP-like cAMP-binding protein
MDDHMDRLTISQDLFNGMLDLLPRKDLAHLAPLLSIYECHAREVVANAGEPITHVYFPYNAVMASVLDTDSGSTFETGLIGFEGFAPVDAFFGKRTAANTVLCKLGGTSLRMPVHDFLYECNHSASFRYVMQLYIELYTYQLSRQTACTRLHSLEKRYARAILALTDRTSSSEIHVTQDLLARLLGVYRPSLNECARRFEAEGAVRFERGRMIVTSRMQLEAHACECYRLIRRESERTLGLRTG